MPVGKGKRPRDPNQLAKWIVDQSTNDTPEAPAPPAAAPVNLSEYIGCDRAQRRSDRREAPPEDHDEGGAQQSCCKGCWGAVEETFLIASQMYAGGQTLPALGA